MNDKLKELTMTLYQDGIERANTEAKAILDNAKIEGDNIIKAATEEANKIKEKAMKEGTALKEKINAEVALTFNQTLSHIKNEINNLITLKVSDAILDSNWISKVVELVISNFTAGKIEVSKELSIELEKLVKGKAQESFKKNFTVSINNDLLGLRVTPKNASYFIDFTKDSFSEYLKEHLNPITQKVLFQ